MGHINHDDLCTVVKDGTVEGIDLNMDSKPEFCNVCIKAKAAQKPFPKKITSDRVKAYNDKVSKNVWRPAQVESLGGKWYYDLFWDKHLHKEKVYFMHHKSESLDYYKCYKAWAKVQQGAVIKVLGCDRGGVYTGKEFTNYLEHQDTVHHLTVHDSPASNGGPEHANCTHLDIAWAMIIQSSQPNFLWAEAIWHDVWLWNQAITRAIPEGKTLHEIVMEEKPNVARLLEWGSQIWVKKLDVGKLEPWALEAIFIRYDNRSKCTNSPDNMSALRGTFILIKMKHFHLILPKLRGKQQQRPILAALQCQFHQNPLKQLQIQIVMLKSFWTHH